MFKGCPVLHGIWGFFSSGKKPWTFNPDLEPLQVQGNRFMSCMTVEALMKCDYQEKIPSKIYDKLINLGLLTLILSLNSKTSLWPQKINCLFLVT